MVKATLGLVRWSLGVTFEVLARGLYIGTVAVCAVRGHRPIEGRTRCQRCFERCDLADPLERDSW